MYFYLATISLFSHLMRIGFCAMLFFLPNFIARPQAPKRKNAHNKDEYVCGYRSNENSATMHL